MKKSFWTASLAAALFALSASTAVALPPPGGDPPIKCPPGYHLEDDICVKNKPPAPSNSPVVTMSLARQTTAQTGVRVVGRATDADQPSAALTVRIFVDGVLKAAVTANQPDPPVASPGFAKTATVPPPTVPGGHTFDITVSAPAGAQNVCVTAVNAGSTGSDSSLCKPVDRVLEFQVNRLDYDLAHAVITAESAEQLDHIDTTNNSDVQQSSTISGSRAVANTHGWTVTTGLKVTATGSVGLPLVAEGKISVEVSASLAINSSETTTNTFSWSQPIVVPPHSRIIASVAVTKTTINVPFSLVGNYVYASGSQVAGTQGGMFSGVNGHDLHSEINQLEPNGTPAAKPVPQPQLRVL